MGSRGGGVEEDILRIWGCYGVAGKTKLNRCLGAVCLSAPVRAGAESLDVDVTRVAKIPQDMMAMPTSFVRELKN